MMNIYRYKLVIDWLSSQWAKLSGNFNNVSNNRLVDTLQISACILLEMRLNLSKCGPLTKYSLIFCYILDDLKMSLYTIYEAPGKLCFLYPTPFSSIFFLPRFFIWYFTNFAPLTQFISFYCQIFHFRKTETDILSKNMK